MILNNQGVARISMFLALFIILLMSASPVFSEVYEIKGKMILEDFVGDTVSQGHEQWVTIETQKSGASESAFFSVRGYSQEDANTLGDGAEYTIDVGLPGTYTLWAKSSHWLRKRVGNIEVPDHQPPFPGTAHVASYSPTSLIEVTYNGAHDNDDDTDGIGLAKVELWYRMDTATTWTKWTADSIPDSNGSGSFSFDLSSLGLQGQAHRYYFDLVAEDLAGNRSADASGDGDCDTAYKISIVYVKQNGNDVNNGTSWALAKATVQSAIDKFSATGGEVWVATGKYGRITNLKSNVKVYGGFTVNDDSMSDRNWKTKKTILDGDGSDSVVTINGSTGCQIDGFTIRNGNAYCGGGIYCSNYASATIANNVIRANSVTYGGSGLGSDNSTLTVVGNVFVDNKISVGGGCGAGIYYWDSNGKIVNNTIIFNNATSSGWGGGICLLSSSPELSNNIIAFNNAVSGGGIHNDSGSPVFTNNDVWGNTVDQYNFSPAPVNDISADPCMPNENFGDWHIGSVDGVDSPCIDAGAFVSGITDVFGKDIDKGNRVYGTSVDIGADEWDDTVHSPALIYVKQNGNDSNDGLSWETAVATVQNGIDKVYDADGGEVWVAAGTYGRITDMPSYVKVYGGFTVNDDSMSDRNWKTNKTILDGGGTGGSVVTINGRKGCQIDGFTIRNGGGEGGRGITCSRSTATIANNIIRGNNAGSSNGGGLYASGPYSSLTVVGNVFVDNVASSGGGIYYTSTSGQIANNTIICNTATSNGGGIYLYTSPADLYLSNNIVASNSGYGIYRYSGSSTNLQKNDVWGNTLGQYNFTPTGTDISADPCIPNIGFGDWHIDGDTDSPTSCQDTGVFVTGITDVFEKDIDANNRVFGSAVDIGADEWDGIDPSPTVIHVKPQSQGGNDNNDGLSWETAVATVQKGIDLSDEGGGSEVWVAAGTYTGTKGRITDLKSNVRVYGGFAGDEDSKSDRNWKTNKTILDGGTGGSVVTINGRTGCQIDGFAIRNGGGTDGRGITCTSSTATIANNIIRRNNNGISNGGGLYAFDSSLQVLGNVFVYNTAGNGSGIYYSSTSGLIANNTVISNSANSDGGGIYLTSSSPVLSNNIIAFNTGGGIYKSLNSSPTFTKNDVYGNDDGGKYEYSWTTTYPVGTDLVPVDPVIPYIDMGDWHLAATSQCRDPQGTTLAVPMDKDIDHGDRVYGSSVDIGADEWDTSDPPEPPSSQPCALVFCIDVTGSISGGSEAIPQIVDLVDYLAENNSSILFGGVKFGDLTDSDCDNGIRETYSLTSDVSAFKVWLQNGHNTDGGDTPEDQLDALLTAISLLADSSNKYIALATDSEYHAGNGNNNYPLLSDVIDALTIAGCHGYIDPGTADKAQYYKTTSPPPGFDLAVGGEIEGSLGSYTFPYLKAAIVP